MKTFEEYWMSQPQYMDENTNNHIKHVAERAFNAGQQSTAEPVLDAIHNLIKAYKDHDI